MLDDVCRVVFSPTAERGTGWENLKDVWGIVKTDSGLARRDHFAR